jgi:hypothetical protein
MISLYDCLKIKQKDKGMKQLTVILCNHHDVDLFPFLGKHLDFLKERQGINTICVECVPCTLEGDAVLAYLKKTMKGCTINFSAKKARQYDLKLGNLEKLANGSFATDIFTFYEEVSPELAREIGYHKAENSYYYYKFLESAIKLGIEIKGAEAESYTFSQISLKDRDLGMIEAINSVLESSKSHVLYIVGAAHARALLNYFCARQKTQNNMFYLLVSDHMVNAEETGFVQCKKLANQVSNEDGLHLGYGSHLQAKSLIGLSPGDQSKQFQKLFTQKVLGAGLPNTLLFSMKQGQMRKVDLSEGPVPAAILAGYSG